MNMSPSSSQALLACLSTRASGLELGLGREGGGWRKAAKRAGRLEQGPGQALGGMTLSGEGPSECTSLAIHIDIYIYTHR